MPKTQQEDFKNRTDDDAVRGVLVQPRKPILTPCGQSQTKERIHVGDIPYDRDEPGDEHAHKNTMKPRLKDSRDDHRQANTEEETLQVPEFIKDGRLVERIDKQTGDDLPHQTGNHDPSDS